MTATAPEGPDPGRGGPVRTRPAGRGSHDGTDFVLHDLVLLDSAGNYPVSVHALEFGDDGIGLIGRPGRRPRVLPWESVSTHAVEPWAGGAVPSTWVAGRGRARGTLPADHAAPPGEDRSRSSGGGAVGGAGEPGEHPRPLPDVDAGALIHIRTPSGTFRFLLPGGDPVTLADRISAIAVRHRGASAASSVTRAVGSAEATTGSVSTWTRWRPVVIGVTVALVAAAVVLILLQSSGAVHLPFLGGTGSGSGTGTVGQVSREALGPTGSSGPV
jgi:hypothetical protein